MMMLPLTLMPIRRGVGFREGGERREIDEREAKGE